MIVAAFMEASLILNRMQDAGMPIYLEPIEALCQTQVSSILNNQVLSMEENSKHINYDFETTNLP